MKIYEIFTSISGEVGGFPQGARAGFIRLGGCNLRCPYCDTPETQTRDKSKNMHLDSIVKTINDMKVDNIVITGGEPLLQMEDVIELCYLLNKSEVKRKISIETNGTIPISEELLNMAWVTIVADFKITETPADYINRGKWDNEKSKRIEEVFGNLRSTDFIKFVCMNPYDIALAARIQQGLKTDAQFAYSPVIESDGLSGMESMQLVQLDMMGMANSIMDILNKLKLNAVVNVQIHKFLGLQ